jgi:hypothetical protein
MGKRVAIAASIAAVVIVLGAVLYNGLFSQEQTSASRLRSTDASLAPSDAEPRRLETEVRVVEIDGAVDREVDGQWIAVKAGDVLTATDSIRTRQDGRAVLDVGGVTVELDQVSELSRIVATRVELSQGRVSARVPSGRDTEFGVAVEGSDAVAETRSGAFAVLADGEGAATVAAVEGSVRVTAKDKTVEVPAGRQSIVASGAEPGAPTAIPESLFLKVQKPRRRLQRSKKLSLSGTTIPGAVLTVNGQRVEVDTEGRFTAVVPLEEGENRVVVQTRDVSGRSDSADVGIKVDTRGPDVGGSVTWGKNKRQ